MRRMSQVRGERYGLLRGLFLGRDEVDAGVRLHSVTLEPGARAVGRTVAELDLPAQVRALRRRGVKANLDPGSAGVLETGDVVVLLGTPDALAAAEEQLTSG
jgi:CPA2 family monovalent cation:H+ antiporter-2